MKSLEHPAVTAFGATTILLLTALAPLASPLHKALYHLYGPLSVVLWPLLINFAGLWLLLTLLLLWGARRRWLNGCVWAALGVGLPWMLVVDGYELKSALPPPHGVAVAFLCVLLLGIPGALIWRSQAFPLLRACRELATVMLSFVALSGLVLLAQVLWSAWRSHQIHDPRPFHQQQAVRAAHPDRIVWLVLDELSYKQLYGKRYAGLQLPAFDSLAAGATVFTHTLPAGYYTEMVLPSLMTGASIDNVRAPAAGFPLQVRSAATHTWKPFDPLDTVFEDALHAGYVTAVAGWDNPYCRLLPAVLDQCFWTNHAMLRGGIFPDRSTAWNAGQPVLHPLLSHVPWLDAHLLHSPDWNNQRAHELDYRELLAAGDRLLEDPSVTFMLLHMPIPHLPGIYDRHAASFTGSTAGYVDNLALCDVYLAHLRQVLQQNGTWDDTTLVIMGDHSWRVSRGRVISPDWTAEEESASEGGIFDDRPGYIVKLPSQHTPAHIDTPFAAVRTRALFDQLITGRIRTPEQLASWVQADSRTHPGRSSSQHANEP